MKIVAITLGPIYDAILQARKTRQLWGTSYLFSYIMREIIKELIDSGVDEKDILLPLSNSKKRNLKLGTGLFPDRLILSIPDGKDDHNLIQPSIERVFEKLRSNAKLKNDHADFLSSYIQTYHILTEVDEKKENIIKSISSYLDSIENQKKYVPNIHVLSKGWNGLIDKLNKPLFYKDAAIEKFPSIPEIATYDLKQHDPTEYEKLVPLLKDDDEKEEEFYEALAKSEVFKNYFRNYHKYIAVVTADGDNIGATINEIGSDPSNIRAFSEALFKFAQEATNVLNNWGAKPVYVGGDDLLFFSPVARINPESIETTFSLLFQLDQLFQDKVVENSRLKSLYDKGLKKPTLSYGVSISYAKFPMHEALESAYSLLREAKNYPDPKNVIKNCINFRLLKHSGQQLGFIIDKNKIGIIDKPKSFNLFLSLCSVMPTNQSFLSSVMYQLMEQRVLLNKIASSPDAYKRLQYFFDENFNEQIHIDNQEFLNRIRDFTFMVYRDFPNDIALPDPGEQIERRSNLVKVYSTLRFVHFIGSHIDEH